MGSFDLGAPERPQSVFDWRLGDADIGNALQCTWV
jgi:hypothetical protein